MSMVLGFICILLVMAIGYIFSNDKKGIHYKSIGIMLVLQFLTGWFVLGTELGIKILDSLNSVFSSLITSANSGVQFVFGGLAMGENATFFFSVLLNLVFFGALFELLNYLKILPFITKWIGKIVGKVTGTPQIETFQAINNIFFGQSDSLLAIRSQFKYLNGNRLFTVCVSAMASVSASIIGAYIQMIPYEYVFVALPLNVFSGLILASLVTPVNIPKEEDVIDIENASECKSLLDAIGNGATTGFQTAVIVGVMLMAYLGLIHFINTILSAVANGLTLETVLGWIFAPIAFIMGVPTSDIVSVGGIMGEKIIANEFVAMAHLKRILETLQPKSIAIISTFLISFANLSSIGMVLGTLKVFDEKKAEFMTKNAGKLLLVSTLASVITACVVGIIS